MSRFLSTIPTNHGFVNLGNVEAYPTGGSGPTAFGPTSYFGSDPRPPELGDNLNNPIDIGNFDPLFSSQTISGTHGGLTRRQSTFYKFTLKCTKIDSDYTEFQHYCIYKTDKQKHIDSFL